MAEFTSVGEHCFLCKTLDFLPVPCSYCEHYFCKHHFSTQSHECHAFNEAFTEKDVKIVVKGSHETPKCAFCASKIKVELEVTKCDKCELLFCLNHRHPEGHNCKSLEDEKVPLNVSEVKKCVKTVQPSKGAKGAKNEQLAKKVAFMKLKQTAKGVPSLPPEERLYFNVTFESKTNPFYLSKEWTIGKCVDWLSNQFNANHRRGAEKLVLTKDETNFPFDVTLKELQSNSIFSGDDLLLRYMQ